MKTKDDVEKEFRSELQELLNKYNASLEAKDHFMGYAECGEDVRMTVYIPAIYDSDGKSTRGRTEIDLGSYLQASAADSSSRS